LLFQICNFTVAITVIIKRQFLHINFEKNNKRPKQTYFGEGRIERSSCLGDGNSQESSPQTGRRSAQPFLHIPPACETDWMTDTLIIDRNSVHSMRPKIVFISFYVSRYDACSDGAEHILGWSI